MRDLISTPTRRLTRRIVSRRATAAVLAAFLAACTPEASVEPTPDVSPSLAKTAAAEAGQSALGKLRAATAKYHRVEQALADGYVNTRECVAIPTGGMGIHYVNLALRADPSIDPLRPEVLVYEPQRSGKLQLVAVEYFVFRAAWDAVSPSAGPSVFGTPFFRSFGTAAHGLADHYELHAWIWRENPDGMFAQWNPKVTCPSTH